MKKDRNIYKIIVISSVCVFLSVCIPYGVRGMAYDFARWMNDGMSAKDAQCAMFLDSKIKKPI